MNKTHVFSSGGGVQSTAALVLAAQGAISYKTFIFANVGDKAESPATIKYIDQVLKPYAAEHGIEWVDVSWVDRQGRQRDLYDDLLEQERSINIPAYMPGGMPGNRKCTEYFKIKPIAKWIKANAPGCTLGKGISTDEPHRATPSRESDGYTSAYPLIELGISRADCLTIPKKQDYRSHQNQAVGSARSRRQINGSRCGVNVLNYLRKQLNWSRYYKSAGAH